MFYTYDQNNSGGGFDYDESRGLGIVVIVEADSASLADDRAEEIGLYFDGEDDCDCCGNRWYAASSGGDTVPSVYGTPVQSYAWKWKWAREGFPEAFVHFADGRVEGYGAMSARAA
ncbi:hypothetical protein OG436_29560 [Streptomyces caniferus]|uniref:DUF7296 family protein n=1 Tax=Streptomyces caniferus TaxID=285557 RepID=UPI002E28D88F|nr:hypothetical protein [Streptomyces caniferus]